MTLGLSHVLESHQPNENGSDETHSVYFPGLLRDRSLSYSELPNGRTRSE